MDLKKRPQRQVFVEPPASLFPSRSELLKLLAVVFIAAAVAAACNYASLFLRPHRKPFCDPLLLEDSCEPCPEHGHCSGGILECFHGYKRHGKICIEDGMVQQIAAKLSDVLELHVCNAYAQNLCNEARKIWFEEVDMNNIIDEYKMNTNPSLNDDAFALAKKRAMDSAESILETRPLLNRSKEYKCPEILAEVYKPHLCRIREWMYKNAVVGIPVLGLLVGLLRFLWKLRQRHCLLLRAEELYRQVCEILEENSLSDASMNKETEVCIVASWLRDHLLLPKERRNPLLWKKVEELILQDSRVAQYPKLIKGEAKTVLQWQVDSSLSSSLKKRESSRKMDVGSKLGDSSVEEKRRLLESSPLHKYDLSI